MDTYRKYPTNDTNITSDFLVRWLNTNILKDPPLGSFPGRLRDDDGESLIALLEELSGKDVYTGGKRKKKSRKPQSPVASKSSADRLKESRERFSKILSFLQSFGGLAHSISPDYLLSRDLFLRAQLEDINRKRDAEAYTELRKNAESKFQFVSLNSWLVLMMQICKVFLLRRVYPKWYASLPGIVGTSTNATSTLNVSSPGSNSSSSSSKPKRRRGGGRRHEEEESKSEKDLEAEKLAVLGTAKDRRALKHSNVYSVR